MVLALNQAYGQTNKDFGFPKTFQLFKFKNVPNGFGPKPGLWPNPWKAFGEELCNFPKLTKILVFPKRLNFPKLNIPQGF